MTRVKKRSVAALLIVLCAGLLTILFATQSTIANAVDSDVSLRMEQRSIGNDYETNENLLDLPEYPNTVTAGLTAAGNNFSVNSFVSNNFLISNDYVESMEFYRPDIDEYSDGLDMDFVVSADVVFGEYASPTQGYYGGGIIFGETNSGYMVVRLMQAGYAYIHAVNKITGYDLINEWNCQCGSFATSVDTKVNVEVRYVDGKLSIFFDGSEALKEHEIKLTPKFGVHAQNNKIKIENFDFRFIQPIRVTQATPKSEETAKFAFDTRGKMNSTRVGSVITGDSASFTVTAPQTADYFLMQSKARELENLYRMTGKEIAVPIENKMLTTVLSAHIKNVSIGENGNLQIVFRHDVSGYDGAKLAFFADGSVTLLTGSGTSPTTVATANSQNGFEDFTLRIISSAQTLSLYVNSELLFKNEVVPLYDNIVGFGGVNAAYTVDELSYKYMEDVRLAAPEKELFVNPVPSGDANVEYITPALPLPREENTTATVKKKGCGSVIASAVPLFAVMLLWAASAALVWRKCVSK